MITSEFIEPKGNVETWAGGKLLESKPVIYGTTVYSVGTEAVSQWQQTGLKTGEAIDYFTGRIYEDLPLCEAQGLALQLAQAYAYLILTSKDN